MDFTEFQLKTMEIALWVLGLLFLLGSIDDLLIDGVHTLLRLRPRAVPLGEWTRWLNLPERKIAVLIPAWQEHAVLEAMVKTNRARVRYSQYRFFVGVYPNDAETLEIARKLEAQYPELMTVVVADRPGPTSKAHCLNCILRTLNEAVQIAEREGQGWIPDLVAIHDAEDVLHPLSFKAVNAQIDFDFLQVPIFSLPVPATAWVAGTYMDEFAEIHFKELPVRAALQMPIPSAGVGTFFDWNFFKLLGERMSYWFDENNLTEDYEISQRIAQLGGRQKFLLVRDPEGQIVATREYFPDAMGRSIRQKTRWTTGISLQTWKKWGWLGVASKNPLQTLAARYAFWRDRKALWSNPASVAGWITAALTLLFLKWPHASSLNTESLQKLRGLFYANTALLSLRLFQRARFTHQLYGFQHGLMAIPRLLVSTWINTLASLRASLQYLGRQRRKSSQPIQWDKTDHRFPTLSETKELHT